MNYISGICAIAKAKVNQLCQNDKLKIFFKKIHTALINLCNFIFDFLRIKVKLFLWNNVLGNLCEIFSL